MKIVKNALFTRKDDSSKEKQESIWDIIKFIILALVIVIPIRLYVAQPFLVKGRSMDPTLTQKDYLIVDELSYNLRDPKRGEVIIFRYPNNPKEHFVKRVIGIPGDTIQIINGTVTIITKEGKTLLLDEPYVTNHSYESLEDIVVPPENLFVMGDNRAESYDSRMWKFLPMKLSTGRAFLRLYPFDKIDYLPGEYLFTELDTTEENNN